MTSFDCLNKIRMVVGCSCGIFFLRLYVHNVIALNIPTRTSEEIETALQRHGIVPQLIDRPPKHAVQVAYGDKAVDFGNNFTAREIEAEPSHVSWPADKDSLYTLILTDDEQDFSVTFHTSILPHPVDIGDKTFAFGRVVLNQNDVRGHFMQIIRVSADLSREGALDRQCWAALCKIQFIGSQLERLGEACKHLFLRLGINVCYALKIGPDVPTHENPEDKECQHWIVGNIPGDNVFAGFNQSEYRGILSFYEYGCHRLIFMVYKQPNKQIITFTEERREKKIVGYMRAFFQFKPFAEKYKLGEPIAINFFLVHILPYPYNLSYVATMNESPSDKFRNQPLTSDGILAQIFHQYF